jgi:glycosyltransferase involved in cell wall biosynthesis
VNILFLARMTMAFDGNTVSNRPLGGSESALLYISRELAAMGHNITIINNCGSGAGMYAGVQYRQFTTLNDVVSYSKENPVDIFVAFRDLPALLFPVKAKKKLWWGQDDFSNIWNNPFPLNILGYALLRAAGFLANRFADKFIVVSNWMAGLCNKYLGIPSDKLYITRNGVYVPYFEAPEREPFGSPEPTRSGSGRNPCRLAYTSVPWRGLDILLGMFPRIKEQVPEAELNIFCGLELGIVQERDKKRAQKILEKTSFPGVKIMGTRKHAELARELGQCALMVYPSYECREVGFWGETSGVSILESLAAGTPVIASDRGAIPEAVKTGINGIIIGGDPRSGVFQEKFIKETVSLMKDPERLSRMSEEAAKRCQEHYSYKVIAKEWETEFEGMLV